MASKPGGYSGGSLGAMGSRVGGASGTGFSDRPGGFGGAQGATARRTSVQSPSYDASLGNLARMAASLAPGGGLLMGGKALVDGDFSGGYTGYGGMVNTPGSYDPTNRAMQVGGGQAGYGPAVSQMFNPIQQNAVLRGGMYGGGTNALKLAQLHGQRVGSPMAAAPQQQQAAPAAQPLAPKKNAPGMFLNTGGKYGISQFRPGYSFYGPGSY